jgi:hypothetical protein
MNYFICKLEALGKQIGFPKLDIDFAKCTNKQLSKYCKRDVEILLITCQEYINWFLENDLGNFGVTISSQSFNTYRHKFMKYDIFIHNRKYVSDLERRSYFGGRTECFKLGNYTNDKYYYLDINSMYPSVMKNNWYPSKYLTYDLKCTLIKLKYYLKNYCLVARVEIDTKEAIVPVRKIIIDEDKYYKKIYREWDLWEKDKRQSVINSISGDFIGLNPIQALKKWVKEKGGLKPEYFRDNGKLKQRGEYTNIPSYLKRKNGTPADELSGSLVEEYPELAMMFNIKSLLFHSSDQLIKALSNKISINETAPPGKFTEEMIEELRSKDIKRQETSGKVIFPIGRFETVLATPELRLALSKNVIVDVKSVALYEKSKIFKSFIEFFYNARLEAKKEGKFAYDTFYKIIMNSLYGKFGQLLGEWTTVGKCDPKEVEYWNEVTSSSKRIYKYRKINGLVQRYENKSEAFNSFPAISSHVSSYARVKLYRLIKKAGKENTFYCDTDSLFVNSQGYNNLISQIHKTKLGKLKVEHTTNSLKLLGCKSYSFGDQVKYKGRRKNAKKIGKDTYLQDQWSSLKSLIKNKDLTNYEVNDIVKHYSNIYDKGILQKDGSVSPLIL